MTEIDRIGIERAAAGGDRPGVGSRVRPRLARPRRARPGGRTGRRHAGERWAHLSRGALACEDIAESGVVGSLELVEVNPILDRENASAAIAVELAASALGQRSSEGGRLDPDEREFQRSAGRGPR